MWFDQGDRGRPSTEETFIPRLKGRGDEELVGQVAQGDERALSELYDRYSRPVYATGVRLLGDAHLAEELVQDAFTNVWQGLHPSTRRRRVSRLGYTESPATGQWIWPAGDRPDLDPPGRTRCDRSPAAQSPR